MPAYIQQGTAAFFDIADSVKIPDYSNVISVLQKTWDAQTFNDLKEGKVALPDDVINNYLAQAIQGNDKVSEVKITSLEDNKFKLTAHTASMGRVEMLCLLKELQHDKNHSQMTIQLLSKKLPDKPLMSFLFSHVSMAMVVKLAGPIDAGKGINLDYRGNTVHIDFRQALYDSALGKAEFYGFNLLDAVNISGATTKPGEFMLNSGLDLPDNIKNMIGHVLDAIKND